MQNATKNVSHHHNLCRKSCQLHFGSILVSFFLMLKLCPRWCNRCEKYSEIQILSDPIIIQPIDFAALCSQSYIVVKMDTLGCGGKVGIRGKRAPYWGCTWQPGGGYGVGGGGSNFMFKIFAKKSIRNTTLLYFSTTCHRQHYSSL